MSLVPSLLQAIVRVDGEALVMHAGDKPYVVSPSGQIELANRGLTIGAVNGIVGQLLPPTFQTVLEEFGAVQYELPEIPEFPGEHFTVVAARGGEDVWTEIRRRRKVEEAAIAAPALVVASEPTEPPVTAEVSAEPAPQAVADAPVPAQTVAAAPTVAPEAPVAPAPTIAPVAPVTLAAPVVPVPVPETPPTVVASTPEVNDATVEEQEPTIEIVDDDDYARRPDPAQVQLRARFSDALDDEGEEIDLNAELDEEPVEPDDEPVEVEMPPVHEHQVAAVAASHAVAVEPPSAVAEYRAATIEPPAAVADVRAGADKPEPVVAEPPVAVEAPRVVAEPAVAAVVAPTVVAEPAAAAVVPPTVVAAPAAAAVVPPQVVIAQAPVQETPIAAAAPVRAVAAESPAAETPVAEPEVPAMAASVSNLNVRTPFPAPRAVPPPQPPANVLPILRSPIRSDQPPPPVSDSTLSGLERLLRLSAARGASTLYLSSGSRPSVRVDGELHILDGEPVHVSRDVESLLLTLLPERNHEALRTGAATEWICEIEGVGLVRCMSFRDHLGPGGVFRMMPTRPVSTDQLGLPLQVQSLAIEPEGLVLVSGSRSSGKRTLMAAFVDLMNRTRRDHIISIEREVNIVHERGQSFISQREVRGDDEAMLAAARAALREDPDVLFIEDLRTGPLMNVALEAAASGHLVVGGFSAHTATGAIDRIIDLYAPEYRRQVQFALADSLRGVIVQALLRKIGGGRLAAREVLLNTPAVSSVIAEGKTSQLPMAIEGGRRYGMMPLNDALVGLVQNGSVEAREAYRHSADRPGFLAALNRNGIDTSFVERLA